MEAADITFTTGDFNGDGAADIALSDDNQFVGSTLVILFGDGQGGFGEPINLSIIFPLESLTAADLNLDGRDDLAYTITFFGFVSIVLSNPLGSFAAPVNYQIGPVVNSPVLKDVDGDGKLDLIVINFFASGFSILSGNGDGAFNQPVTMRVIDAPNVFATGDFNEDGNIDIAFTRSNSSFVGILQNRPICIP